MKFKMDWFLWGMIVAVALAFAWPEPGARGGWLQPELLNKIGVSLIFFLNGVALSFASLKAGAMRWPVHLTVQTTTFVVFPLLGALIMLLPQTWIAAELGIGFFYLCAVPSTVSSSVVMTAAANGNVPVAVFNATLSSVIGIFITPLLIGWKLQTSGAGGPSGSVIVDLIVWLLLPLVAGQVCRRWLADWAVKNHKLINKVDRGTILFIIYTSFCDSIEAKIWSGKADAVGIAVIGSVVLFYAVFFYTNQAARVAGFTTGDKIAAVFCGSKKSIAAGVPMAQLIFAGNPGLGLILLPLMIYHPLQLIICGVMARRYASRVTN